MWLAAQSGTPPLVTAVTGTSTSARSSRLAASAARRPLAHIVVRRAVTLGRGEAVLRCLLRLTEPADIPQPVGPRAEDSACLGDVRGAAQERLCGAEVCLGLIGVVLHYVSLRGLAMQSCGTEILARAVEDINRRRVRGSCPRTVSRQHPEVADLLPEVTAEIRLEGAASLDLPLQALCRGAGLNTEFPVERPPQEVVLDQCFVTATGQRVHAHECLRGVLMRWVGGHDAAQRGSGAVEVGPGLEQQGELDEQGEELGAQHTFGCDHPVLVAIFREQIPSV
jgi:hypothetical protein